MKKPLKNISAKNDLDYYLNTENISNKNLVIETLEYFEKGKRKGFFEPLEFMNLLWKQYNFVNANIQKPQAILKALTALPLNIEQKHVLFGFILKWFGGYPVENMNKQYNSTLSLIEKEFLSYNEQTPEKQFCKADNEERNEMLKLGITISTAINENIEVSDILNEMPASKQKLVKYFTFNQLFEDAVRNGLFVEPIEEREYIIKRSVYNFEFNVWLKENRGYEFGNDEQYIDLLTIDNWKNFINEKESTKPNVPLTKALQAQQTETRTDKLRVELVKYGFFDLKMVKDLRNEKQNELFELLSSNKLPYQIAMINFLGFIQHLKKEHFPTKAKLNKEISKWFNSDKDGRTVKGNINSLSDNTNEDKKRYTAHLHKNEIEEAYQKLK